MQGISREFSRSVDRRATEELRIPSVCLMENAGAGAARLARELLGEPGGTVVCVCGPGNNGGDGMVVARHLAIGGVPVQVVLLASRSGAAPRGDAGVQLAIVEAMALPFTRVGGEGDGPQRVGDELPRLLDGATLVVDGLFGTGLDRALEGDAAEVVAAINDSGSRVLALDVPSGLDCDSGAPLGPCVRATMTATFVAEKQGFSRPGADEWTGAVRVVGIGAPLRWPRERA